MCHLQHQALVRLDVVVGRAALTTVPPEREEHQRAPLEVLARVSVGCERRKCTSRRVNSRKSRCLGVRLQRVQLISSSWHGTRCCCRAASAGARRHR